MGPDQRLETGDGDFTVTRIADAIQPGSRTLLTEIDIPNPDGALTPGIYCTIELHIPRKTPSFTVSADAIIFNQGGLQVAVVENGVVHLRKVAVVRDLGRQVLVLVVSKRLRDVGPRQPASWVCFRPRSQRSAV